jgi:hypothetical protein
MRVALRSLWLCSLLTVLFVSPALAAPWLEVQLTPVLPDHVQNPGGMLSAACWLHDEGTSVQSFSIYIIDPEGTEVYRSDYSGTDYVLLEWVVPEGMLDGMYEYHAEYVAQTGETASSTQRFLVAGLTTGFCAFKYIDDNGNGIYEPDLGETLVPDWEICATPDLGCKLTDADGVACWFFIDPGTYEVCETLPPGWTSTTGECVTVTIASGSIEKAEFGNLPVGACCFHPGGDCVVTTEIDCVAEGGLYIGDFTECNPGLCPPTATENQSWGTVKHLYE